MNFRTTILWVLLCMVFACTSGDRSIRVYKIKKQTPKKSVAMATQKSISWTTPSGWEKAAASSMHLAAFTYEQAKITVMSLPGDGGGMLMNVNRWLGQLSLPTVDQSGLASLGTPHPDSDPAFTTFHLVNEQKKDQAFFISVFQLPSQTVFVKMIAPEETMANLTPSFLEFCQSIKMN